MVRIVILFFLREGPYRIAEMSRSGLAGDPNHSVNLEIVLLLTL